MTDKIVTLQTFLSKFIKMRAPVLKSIAVVFAVFLAPGELLAGGPFFVDFASSGEAITWQNNKINWIADSGALNQNISNTQAIDWVKGLFAIWQNAEMDNAIGEAVDVVNLDVEYNGEVGYDINITNYVSALVDNMPSAVVVFDTTGEIIDKELGANSKKFVVGFASPLADGTGHFAGGIVVLNGLFIDGTKEGSGELSEDEFKAVILHEIGHLLNLDHTQANIEAVQRFEDGDKSIADEIPTMYPVLYTSAQLNPHIDDRTALAEQYPSPSYVGNFCRIEGELKDAGGDGFQGADVVARAADDVNSWSDVRTIVSGVIYPGGTDSGKYVLGGIVPGREYVVNYREIDDLFTGGSSIAPFDPPRSDVGRGVITTASVICAAGGTVNQQETVEMKVGDNSNASSAESGNYESTEVTGPAPGCSLILPLK